ncbi:hypothetical protein APHAL10511_006475 [Amanita phalloides]|nr:hypothetical protein APHAL10511_006475 [Amanita phalloides]
MALYAGFCVASVLVLRELNAIVQQPYMDEPFHIAQAQAYCNGHFAAWDPKITTPPGLYALSVLISRIFLLGCTTPVLRFTVLLSLLSLPLALSRLLSFYRREHPNSPQLSPAPQAIVLSLFPIAWFFGFLYNTDVPSLVSVISTLVAASEDRHWTAALFGLISCTFRQTNIVWVFYAFASSQLMMLRFRRGPHDHPPPPKLHDPPALAATPRDLFAALFSLPRVLPDILPSFAPYTMVLAAFSVFILWNGGIVLGDKANHVPSFHVPQMYYFYAFSTAFGWPVLISGHGGIPGLAHSVGSRMFGTGKRILFTIVICLCMIVTVKLYTIHHPFLLSDNRHYTFYVWRRIYRFHPLVPYLFVPAYLACAWAWYLRAGRDQTMLQTLILPLFTLPTLLPTPLLEPRYFLIPYILMRSQINDVPVWALVLEGLWSIHVVDVDEPNWAKQTRPAFFNTGENDTGDDNSNDLDEHDFAGIMVRSAAGRPITRSSIRQSLGKAFADVMNKDGKDGDKPTKKIKGARFNPAAPRNSMGETRPPLQPVKRTGTPDSVTHTRKRLSTTTVQSSSDENPLQSNVDNGPVTRSATLRPSSRQNTSSALPKYRPKSVVETTKPPPSPIRVNTRRRLRTSDDDKEEKQSSKDSVPSPCKGTRPISPLPHRALQNTTSLASPTTPSTPSRRKTPTPSSAKSSPTLPSRPPKAVKTTSSSVAPNDSREYLSSSSTSGTPRTPKINTAKTTTRRADRENVRENSSTAGSSPARSSSSSPVVHRHLKRVVDLTFDGPAVGNMSHISEATSEEEDVALLLAPVADPSAPTPAMPRLSKARDRDKQLPVTPTRPGNSLPSRAQMSYASPVPPVDTSFLRPRSPNKATDDKIFRGSILSWEQVANEASKTLGEDEVHSMLADVPAPFASLPISPSISTCGIDIPDSPCLSALNSPGAFGSISQVLLPDVTPSPAVHGNAFKYNGNNGLGTVDSSLVTLLKLQLVAAENMSKERLTRLLAMEEEMYYLKEDHKRETGELSMQVSHMQDQLCEKEEYEERLAVERAGYIASLEEQLKDVRALRAKAVEDEIARCRERERKTAYREWHVVMEATCAANTAQAGWSSVFDLSQAELETVKGDRHNLELRAL